MAMKIYEQRAYERYTGETHEFEVYQREIKESAPFVIMLDGSFLATAEFDHEIDEEIEDAIKWFNWSTLNPNYE